MFKPLRNLVLAKRLPNPKSSGLIALPDDVIEQNPYVELLAVNDGKEQPHNFKVGDICFLRTWSGAQIDFDRSKWDSRILVPMQMLEAVRTEE